MSTLWERVEDSANGIITERLRVPDGWVVRSFYASSALDGGSSMAQTYVPDPGHEWRTK